MRKHTGHCLVNVRICSTFEPNENPTGQRCGYASGRRAGASMDYAPGSTIAKLALRTANPIGIQGSQGYQKASHSSTTAIRAPTSRVHKQTRRIPAPAPMIWNATVAT